MTMDGKILFNDTQRSVSPASIAANDLLAIDKLHHDYVLLRHGQSMANVAKIIASDPTIACNQFGLSPIGQEQATNAGHDIGQLYQQSSQHRHEQQEQQQSTDEMSNNGLYYRGVVIISSDLLRARETAMIVMKALQTAEIPIYRDQVILETRLRERGFGDWNGHSDDHYNTVWAQDGMDASHTDHGVESVHSVLKRVTACIRDWDHCLITAATEEDEGNNHQSTRYLAVCVAHGDILQILQTAFERQSGRMHRALPHLETAQIRPVTLRPPPSSSSPSSCSPP